MLRQTILEWLATRVRRHFTTVDEIDCASLYHLLTDVGASPACGESPAQELLLVDVRSPEEFDVSHLPGALSGYKMAEITPVLDQHPHALVVLYCSVGWRSAAMVQQLQMRYRRPIQLLNLSKGIFDWIEQGYPVSGIQSRGRLVHGYGTPWKYLVSPHKRAKT